MITLSAAQFAWWNRRGSIEFSDLGLDIEGIIRKDKKITIYSPKTGKEKVFRLFIQQRPSGCLLFKEVDKKDNNLFPPGGLTVVFHND